MKKLILSFNTYEWVKYCSGMIIRDPYEFNIMVVCKDDRRSILEHPNLCRKAIYEQRRYDLFNIGKALKIKKLYNLGFEPDIINLYKLIAQIQIYILTGQVSEIYYSQHVLLDRLFRKFPTSIPIYSYGTLYKTSDNKPDKEYRLSIKEYDVKKSLPDLMIGINNKIEKLYFSYTENFYKVGVVDK